jgi:hypothetical protein
VKVIVPTVARESVASLALRMEGIPHSEEVLRDDFAYGKLFTRLWDEGEGFIIVEHDIVPWPGALQAMLDCTVEWCGYKYPYFTNYDPTDHLRFFGSHGLGCVKFDDRLVQNYPDLAQRGQWDKRDWQSLDGLIGKTIVAALSAGNIYSWHEHTPPVAHVRAYMRPQDEGRARIQ